MDRLGVGQYWERFWVRCIPKRLLTALVGWFARRPVSRHFIPWFVRTYAIDASEAELALDEYKTWVDFFSRRLRSGVRMVSDLGVASPVDGTASNSGVIEDGMLIQAKGQLYSVAALLLKEDATEFVNGQYITLYLSPHDYHRVHMPVDGKVVSWTYIPGSLYPVNAAGVRTVGGLFTKNERLVLQIESHLGTFAMVLVGATIVGSIRTPFGPEYASPFRRCQGGVRHGETDVSLKRGEEIGRFEFGSTVILLFPPEVRLNLQIEEGQAILMGQTIALETSVEKR